MSRGGNPALPAVRFAQCLAQTASHRYFLDEAAAPPLLSEIPAERADSAALLIGPEGGWTSQDFELFKQQNLSQLNMGNLTLRAETACVTASSKLLL